MNPDHLLPRNDFLLPELSDLREQRESPTRVGAEWLLRYVPLLPGHERGRISHPIGE